MDELEKIALGVGCLLLAPVVAATAIEVAAVAGVVALAVGASEAAVVGAGVTAAVVAEKAVTTLGLAKIAEGTKKMAKG